MKNIFEKKETENTEEKNSTILPTVSRPPCDISGLFDIARNSKYQILFFNLYREEKYSKAFKTICKHPELYHRTTTTELMLNNSFTKVDLNKKRGPYQQTLLHQVAMQADERLYNTFVEKGADPRIADKFGKTPAQYLKETLAPALLAKLVRG